MPTENEIKKNIKDLEKEIGKLEPKLAPLREASEAANLTAADALREWHSGNIGDGDLSKVQGKAMVAAQRLGVVNSQLAEAKDALSKSLKALADLQRQIEAQKE
jgi:septal ring factor EnvC (AmiA/AmiB activator)